MGKNNKRQEQNGRTTRTTGGPGDNDRQRKRRRRRHRCQRTSHANLPSVASQRATFFLGLHFPSNCYSWRDGTLFKPRLPLAHQRSEQQTQQPTHVFISP